MSYSLVMMVALLVIWGGILLVAMLLRSRRHTRELDEMEDLASIAADDR